MKPTDKQKSLLESIEIQIRSLKYVEDLDSNLLFDDVDEFAKAISAGYGIDIKHANEIGLALYIIINETRLL